jgi:hypothetical protein
MQKTTINPNIEKSLKEIRYNLVTIRKASKQDSWTLEERYHMMTVFEELRNAVDVLQICCGMA